MQKGYSQKTAVFILYGITATFGMFAVILLDSGVWKALSFALIVIAILALGYKNIFKLKKNVIKIEKEIKEESIENHNHREDKE